MNLEDIKFLTTNPKKAKDFKDFGLGVESFSNEVSEILSSNVELVALYKARDVNLNNIVVEDTSLDIEGCNINGTQIKHIYEVIKDDNRYHYQKAVWKVSLCMKKDGCFYVATGVTKGILKYPRLETGYHFDSLFAVRSKSGEYKHFESLIDEEKKLIGPRFKALNLLVDAVKRNDYGNLKVIKETDVVEWTGEYQEEISVNSKINKKL